MRILLDESLPRKLALELVAPLLLVVDVETGRIEIWELSAPTHSL